MHTELNRNIPELFLANEATGQPTLAPLLTPREETAATHDFLIVIPLRDFAAGHTARPDLVDGT